MVNDKWWKLLRELWNSIGESRENGKCFSPILCMLRSQWFQTPLWKILRKVLKKVLNLGPMREECVRRKRFYHEDSVRRKRYYHDKCVRLARTRAINAFFSKRLSRLYWNFFGNRRSTCCTLFRVFHKNTQDFHQDFNILLGTEHFTSILRSNMDESNNG
jgi:hypothetical protein